MQHAETGCDFLCAPGTAILSGPSDAVAPASVYVGDMAHLDAQQGK